MRRMAGWALMMLAATLPSWPARAAEDTVRRFYGYAYDMDSGRYAYTEVHAQRIVDGRWRSGRIDYYAPDGRKLGDKRIEFGADPYVARYRMEMAGGYGSAIAEDSGVIVASRTENGRTESGRIDKPATTCADAGFHVYLRDHFDALLGGQTLRFNLVAAARLQRYRFRASKVADTQFDGRPAVVIRFEPDSLLRLLAGPVEMVYEPRERELVEFRGPSNVVDPGTGKPYTVRVIYPARPPADAPAALPPLGA